jgi:hypothetical protein
VRKILESIGRTGFWDNVVVRRHPTKPGRFELAYGHNRLDAVRLAPISTVTLPVADLSNWDVLCAMVDENETQQTITPEIAYENILASVQVITAAFKKIGPKGTEAQFCKAMGRTFGQRRTKVNDGGFVQRRTKPLDCGFESARATQENGIGPRMNGSPSDGLGGSRRVWISP